MNAVAGSGIASMSEASMLFQPRMEGVETDAFAEGFLGQFADGQVKCCQVPNVSTNLMSTIFAPAFFAISITLLGVAILS